MRNHITQAWYPAELMSNEKLTSIATRCGCFYCPRRKQKTGDDVLYQISIFLDHLNNHRHTGDAVKRLLEGPCH